MKKEAHGKADKWTERKLDELPTELTILLKALFDELDSEESRRAICLIQLVLFSHKRLRLSELHCALSFAFEAWPSVQAWKDSEDFLSTTDQRREMVIQLSRGLLEVVRPEHVVDEAYRFQQESTDDQDPTYQFIHESARDFFLKEDGFVLLDPNFNGSISGHGNSLIARVCANYLCCEEAEQMTASEYWSPSKVAQLNIEGRQYFNIFAAWDDLKQTYFKQLSFRFLPYAGTYIFAHLEAAERDGMNEEGILRLFLVENERRFRKFSSWFPLVLPPIESADIPDQHLLRYNASLPLYK